MKDKNPVGRPRKEKILKTVGFRVDPDAYEIVKKKYGKTVSKKVNNFIIRLSKKKMKMLWKY